MKNVSTLFLKPFIESHAIILSSKSFQIPTKRCAKENFLISKRHLGSTNFKRVTSYFCHI